MQRLYLQFYVTILLVLAIFVGTAVLTWQLAEEQTPQYLDVAAELTGALLPDADAPDVDDQRAIDALHRKLKFDLTHPSLRCIPCRRRPGALRRRLASQLPSTNP